MSHRRAYRLFALWISLLSRLVPRSHRDRWAEEWRGEIWHGLQPEPGTTHVAGATLRHVFGRSLGAARDAIASRTRSRGVTVTRRATTSGGFDGIRQDLRFAARGIRKQPAFAAVAILTLTVGIGINAAMFSVVRAVLLNPLPFDDAHELVQVWETRPSQGRDRNVVSYPDFVDWRDQNQVFDAMAAYRGFAAIVPGADRAERLSGTTVTHDFFDVLQASPSLGRGFLPEEDRPGQDPVVILSHRLWRDRFGSQSGAIGDVMIMNGVSYTVVGIMPPT